MLRAAVVAIGFFAIVTGSALASPPPPPPAVQQYIETLPTGGGSHPLSSGVGKPALSPSLAQKIDAQGGPYTPMLKAIAGSGSTGEKRSLDGRLSPTAASNSDVMAAALDSGSAGDRFIIGGIVLGLVIASAVAALRWRSSRRAS